MPWTLHDETGPVRTGLTEGDARELIHVNAEQDPPIVTWATSETGRLESWNGPVLGE